MIFHNTHCHIWYMIIKYLAMLLFRDHGPGPDTPYPPVPHLPRGPSRSLHRGGPEDLYSDQLPLLLLQEHSWGAGLAGQWCCHEFDV